MKKLAKILPKILIGLAAIPLLGLLVGMAYINFAMACVMFEPSTLPKPLAMICGEPQDAAEGEEADAAGEGGPTTAHAASPEEGDPGSHGENSGTPPVAAVEVKPGQGLMLDTGTKIVNLVDPTGRRYLRVGIVLEFAVTDLAYYTLPAEEKTVFIEEFNSEVNSKLAVINDIIITSLSTQTFDSVYTAEGKEALRKKIMDTVNTQLPEYKVIFVYFTEFVVQ
jgi:flagellar FliL protein